MHEIVVIHTQAMAREQNVAFMIFIMALSWFFMTLTWKNFIHERKTNT